MTEWRDISTAPKDGTEVLAYRRDGGCFIARYGAMDIFDLPDSEAEAIDEEDFWAESWWAFGFHGAFRIEGSEKPTHWTLLPRTDWRKGK